MWHCSFRILDHQDMRCYGTRSPFAKVEPNWAKTSHADRLYQCLCEQAMGTGISIGWSSAGFSGIPPRSASVKESTARKCEETRQFEII